MVDQLTTADLETLLTPYWYNYLSVVLGSNTPMYMLYHAIWIQKRTCGHDDFAALMQACVDNDIFDAAQQVIFMAQQPAA
jgi:hypothetical protein